MATIDRDCIRLDGHTIGLLLDTDMPEDQIVIVPRTSITINFKITYSTLEQILLTLPAALADNSPGLGGQPQDNSPMLGGDRRKD